jgi:hypothetical protein
MFQVYEDVTRETYRKSEISKTVNNHAVVLSVMTSWVWYVIKQLSKEPPAFVFRTNNHIIPCHNTEDYSLDSRVCSIKGAVLICTIQRHNLDSEPLQEVATSVSKTVQSVIL